MMGMMAQTFRSDRLKQRRELLGLTQSELSERAGVGINQVHRYEKGDFEPNVRALARFAEELNVTTDWLLGLVNEPNATLDDDDLSPEEKLLVDAFRSKDIRLMMKLALKSDNG